MTSHGQAAAGAVRGVQLDLFDGRRKKRGAKLRTSEHQEQVALMQWAALSMGRWPDLALLHAIPNGGWRHPAVAAGLKKEGVKPGVPDLDLPVARGGYHGLRVELKAKGGTLSDAQFDWIERLRDEGYAAGVCVGWEQARDVIVAYLAMPVRSIQVDDFPELHNANAPGRRVSVPRSAVLTA